MNLNPKLILGLILITAVGVVVGSFIETKFGDQLGLNSYED
jgi:hypothetical protein